MSIMASDAGAFKAATGLFASLDGAWHEVPLGGGGGGGGGGPVFPLDTPLDSGDHFAGPLDPAWTRRNVAAVNESFDATATVLTSSFQAGPSDTQYLKPAPSGDFSIKMKMSVTGPATMLGPVILAANGDGVGASGYSDGHSYLWQMVGYNYGTTGPRVSDLAPGLAGAWHWIQLNRVGTSYKFRISLNGFTWSAWSDPLAWAGTVDRVGFGRLYNGGAVHTLRVDSFEIAPAE
jgi:hypothetical protein